MSYKRYIPLLLILTLLITNVLAISMKLDIPRDEYVYLETDVSINGTASAVANITYRVDSGVLQTACTNCIVFDNMTGALSTGNWHVLDINVSSFVDAGDNTSESIRFQVSDYNFIPVQMSHNLIGDGISFIPKIISFIILLGVIFIVGALFIKFNAKT